MFNNSIYDALLRFEEENIPFPPFASALEIIEAQLSQFRKIGVPQNLLVLGESGTGKSTLCRYLTHKYKRIVLPERDVVPVIYVAVPAGATISSVASEILLALGDPAPDRGTVPAKTHRVITLCRACGVELLLVDEAQHMHDRGQVATHYMVGDWLKQLIDQLQIPTVFLGLPNLEQLLQVNEQLRRRFSRRLYLALGRSDTTSIETECLQLFISLAACLPVPLAYGDLKPEDLGARLSFASDGRVAYIKKILQSALIQVLHDGDTAISPYDLEQAFSRDVWSEGIGSLNPFNAAFVFRKLDRKGEPFEKGALRGRK